MSKLQNPHKIYLSDGEKANLTVRREVPDPTEPRGKEPVPPHDSTTTVAAPNYQPPPQAKNAKYQKRSKYQASGSPEVPGPVLTPKPKYRGEA